MPDRTKGFSAFPLTLLLLAFAAVASFIGCCHFFRCGEPTVAVRIPAIGLLLALAMYVCEKNGQKRMFCVYLIPFVLFMTADHCIFHPSAIDVVRSLFFYATVFDALLLFDSAIRCSQLGKFACTRFLLGLLQATVILVPTALIVHISTGGTLGLHELIAMQQTNLKEAWDFVLINFALWKICCAAATVGVVIFISCTCTVKKQNVAFISLLLFLALASSFPFVRLAAHHFNDNIPLLCKITGSFRNYLLQIQQFKQMRSDRSQMLHMISARGPRDNDTHIVVIGESENRDHMGVYGYKLNTTPWLSSISGDKDMVLFTNAYSCHVQTVQVLTLALTQSSQYHPVSIGQSLSLMDICMAAGYYAEWISNQLEVGEFESAVSVLAMDTQKQCWLNHPGLDVIRSNQYDQNILAPLETALADKSHQRKIIFCHLHGSHFRYSDRYPENFTWRGQKTFSYPADNSQSAEAAEYDSSVLYTDYILSEVVRLAKEHGVSTVTYFSDHSEDVSMSDHSFSKFTYAMSHIPAFVWCSAPFAKRCGTAFIRLAQRSKVIFTNDLMYDTLIGLYGIKTPAYRAAQDLTSASFAVSSGDAVIGGKFRVLDDPALKVSR